MATLGRPPVAHPRIRTVLVRLSDVEWGALLRALSAEYPVSPRQPTPAGYVRDLVVAHTAEVLGVDVERGRLRHQKGGVPDFQRWALARAVRRAAKRRRRRR